MMIHDGGRDHDRDTTMANGGGGHQCCRWTELPTQGIKTRFWFYCCFGDV